MRKAKNQMDDEGAQAAARLKSIWLAYKQEHRCTQEEVAQQIGITQGAFAHYVSGYNPIGMDIALRFANYFNVPMSAIKTFDSFEKQLATELERRKLVQLPDEETIAVVKMLSSVKKEDKARLRWKIETWIEMIPGDVIQ